MKKQLLACLIALVFIACQAEEPKQIVAEKPVDTAKPAAVASVPDTVKKDSVVAPVPSPRPPREFIVPKEDCKDCPPPDVPEILSAPAPDKSVVKPEPIEEWDRMPQFPGGDSAMRAYFNKNIRYPEHEKELGISGRVYIRFAVEKDGSLSSFEVVKEVAGGPGLTKEALRVMKQMPRWIPGKINGQEVRVFMNLPINFTLNY